MSPVRSPSWPSRAIAKQAALSFSEAQGSSDSGATCLYNSRRVALALPPPVQLPAQAPGFSISCGPSPVSPPPPSASRVSQSIALQASSAHRNAPSAQGDTMVTARATVADSGGIELSKTVKVTRKVVPSSAVPSTPQAATPSALNS
jgi:hypothetical protein